MGTQFDSISTAVVNFVKLSKEIGGDVKSQSLLVNECFTKHEQLLRLASTHSKPSESDWELIRESCSKPITDVVKFKDSKRSSPLLNHLSAVAESMFALHWVVQGPAPAPFVKSMQEAAQFYTNRIKKEKDPKHVEWVNSLLTILDRLYDYVQQRHTTGLSWNAKNSQAKPGDLSLSPSRAAGGNVPPVPALKPQTYTVPQSKPDSGDQGGLFAQLNRGESVTAGLRKVNDSMKTHKNPELRAHSLVPQPEGGGGVTNKQTSPRVTPPQSKPVLELRGNKWVVENYRDEQLTISDTLPKHTVYVYNCTGCMLKVQGKINSITLDRCKKFGLSFDSLISSLEVVNCQSVQMQTMGNLSTVTIDKTDGCQVYLSKKWKETSVFTAKSSAVNVLIPDGSGDFTEYPVPEQFRTMFTDNGPTTVPADAPE